MRFRGAIVHKTCTKCRKTLALRHFPTRQDGPYQGHRAVCRICHNAQKRDYYRRFTESVKSGERARHFVHTLERCGLSLEQYQSLLRLQNGVCAICKKPEMGKRVNRLAIDHNPQTDKVRGLLCGSCNRRLGFYEASIPGNFQQYLDHPPNE